MRRLFLALGALALPLALAACPSSHGTGPAHPPGPAAEPIAPPLATGRLPAFATPLEYALDFKIDPDQTRFTGTVRITVDVPKPTPYIVLHGRNLDVTSAALVRGAERTAAKPSFRLSHGGKKPEELVLAFPAPVAAGKAVIEIAWTGSFDDELSGLYRVKDGDRWYAFTHFEPTDARRMFPSFDEPGFKTPFEVTVTVPKGQRAFANAPETSREELATGTRFRFTKTQPLPTYLVALAVGDLEVREAERFTRPPVRIITTKGKATPQMTSIALDAASGLVDALGNWFAIPYPYDKLDIVAVPEFRAGAMENAGLVTFREELLLVDPAHASVAAKKDEVVVIAHELAHQWFGDLVTASWWNDLWLNEGFATWMMWRIVEKWKPSMGGRVDAALGGLAAMEQDGLVSARSVRQPVVTTSDAESAFDGITYKKGSNILTTIERWIGEDAFQRGVRSYIQENAFKSVQSDRLFAALDAASGKDVSSMAKDYLDRPGVPEVMGEVVCEGGRWHMDAVPAQWRPLGSKAPEESMQSWTIPLCARVSGEKTDQCVDLVGGAPAMLAGRGCATWVHPNPGAEYYRFSLGEKELGALADARKQLDPLARVTFLSNAWASVRNGAVDAKAMLRVLPAFDDDDARPVTDLVAQILHGMSDTVVDPEDRVAFRKFAAARMERRKKRLGWTPPAKGEALPEDALARPVVMLAMGDVAEDDTTRKEAEAIAKKWLADPSSVDGDAGAAALDLASRKADAPRLAELQQAFRTAKTREHRIAALRAMFGFDDDAILRSALDFTLGDEVKTNELRYVLAAAFGRRIARPIAEAWVEQSWDRLAQKYPGRLLGYFARAAGVGCSDEDAAARTAFFEPRLAKVEGSDRILQEALESVSLCGALRAKSGPTLKKALLGRK